MFLRAAAFRADAFAARFLGGVVGSVIPPVAEPRHGGYPRRIKRVKTVRPVSLREMFSRRPESSPVAEPEPLTSEIVAPSSRGGISIETVAPDVTPLIDGLKSLRAALEAQAMAQAIEDDDAEVLMVMT